MRLKSFQAKSMVDIMRQIKETLGEDAIIVSTREEAGFIRVTAAVQQDNEDDPKAEEFSGVDIIEVITDTLLKHRVPGALSDKMISAAKRSPQESPRKTLAAALQQTFDFSPSAQKAKRPVFLAGPPGAGKTLMAAKMAARAVLNGKKAAVITTDIFRAGSVEQLQAFLDILSLPLQQATTAKDLKHEIAKVNHVDQIIIDTGGLNPFDPQEMKELARLISAEDVETALVIPAGIDAEEGAEIALAFAKLGMNKIIPTRLDFARRLGGILNAADRAKLPFTESSHTPQVADGILDLTPDNLSFLLMPPLPKKG